MVPSSDIILIQDMPLRFNVINGTIGASGEYDFQPWNPDPNDNYWEFSKNVLDISLQFEFNYLKYIVGEKETPWSTYVFGGFGVQTYSYNITYLAGKDPVSGTIFTNTVPGSEISPTIPFGLGFKFDLSKRIGIGIEGGLRKSFSDKLDNLDDPLSYTTTDDVAIKYADQLHNNDWIAYVGVHFVYKLIYGNQGWELRTRKQHHMIDWGIKNSTIRE